MPFIAERIYQSLKQAMENPKESVHLEKWPEGGKIDEQLIKDMKATRDAVSSALMMRTKVGISVRQPLASARVAGLPEGHIEIFKDEVNVKDVVIIEEGESTELDTNLTEDLVREGDIRNLMRAVQDIRKEKGLSPKDKVILKLFSFKDLGNLDELRKVCNISNIEKVTSVQLNKVSLSFGEASFDLTSNI